MKTPDFDKVLFSLLPPGVCFRKNAANLGDLLSYAAGWFWHIEDEAFRIIGEIPGHLNDHLPEWERITGLPDKACLEPENFLQRQSAIITRLSATGGQSPAYLEEVANSVSSYPEKQITVQRQEPLKFSVNGVDIKKTFFRAGSSSGNRVQRYKRDDRVICEIERIKHAHVRAYYYDTEQQHA